MCLRARVIRLIEDAAGLLEVILMLAKIRNAISTAPVPGFKL
jgi:hypothetical protein